MVKASFIFLTWSSAMSPTQPVSVASSPSSSDLKALMEEDPAFKTIVENMQSLTDIAHHQVNSPRVSIAEASILAASRGSSAATSSVDICIQLLEDAEIDLEELAFCIENIERDFECLLSQFKQNPNFLTLPLEEEVRFPYAIRLQKDHRARVDHLRLKDYACPLRTSAHLNLPQLPRCAAHLLNLVVPSFNYRRRNSTDLQS